jgi:hypothetical protein
VGADYAQVADAVDEIAEANDAKRARLAGMVGREAAGDLPQSYDEARRWIGALLPPAPKE